MTGVDEGQRSPVASFATQISCTADSRPQERESGTALVWRDVELLKPSSPSTFARSTLRPPVIPRSARPFLSIAIALTKGHVRSCLALQSVYVSSPRSVCCRSRAIGTKYSSQNCEKKKLNCASCGLTRLQVLERSVAGREKGETARGRERERRKRGKKERGWTHL